MRVFGNLFDMRKPSRCRNEAVCEIRGRCRQKCERDVWTHRQRDRQTDTLYLVKSSSGCLCVSPDITLTFLLLSPQKFTHNFIPTPGMFSQAFRPMPSFLISGSTLKLIEATLHIDLSPLFGPLGVITPLFHCISSELQ